MPLPAFTLSFDLDFKDDIERMPEILAILDKYELKVSFAAIGMWVEKEPEVHRSVLAAGHEILNHTYSHPDCRDLGVPGSYRDLSEVEIEEEISKCEAVFEKHLNYKAVGFRMPHFAPFYNANTFPVLKRRGYRYDTSTVDWRSHKPGDPYKRADGIIEFPLTCFPHLPFTLMDTWTAFSRKDAFWNKLYLPEFKLLIKTIEKYRLYGTVYLDASTALQEGILDEMCRTLAESSVNVLRYCDIIETHDQVSS